MTWTNSRLRALYGFCNIQIWIPVQKQPHVGLPLSSLAPCGVQDCYIVIQTVQSTFMRGAGSAVLLFCHRPNRVQSRRWKSRFSSTSLCHCLNTAVSSCSAQADLWLSRFLTNISASARWVTVICVTKTHLTRLDHCSETTQSNSSACFALRRLWPLTCCALWAQSGVTKAIHLFLLWAKKEPGVARCLTTTNNKEKDLHGGASICLLDFDGVNSQSFTLYTSHESPS